jgi:hypothetical protein
MGICKKISNTKKPQGQDDACEALCYSRLQHTEEHFDVPVYNPLSKNFRDEEIAKLRGTAVLSLKGEYHRILAKQPFVV